MTPPVLAVKLEAVTKSFGTRRVLDGVTLEVPQGCGFVILGRSGTGKSVTLRHIIGLVRPDAGRVFVHGSDITELKGASLADVRKQVGFLFQSAALFDSISVGENVAFPMRRHTNLHDAEIRQRAQAKLESVGLGSDYDKMPGDLSGGMRKRAGLARATPACCSSTSRAPDSIRSPQRKSMSFCSVSSRPSKPHSSW
jgi:phospholipid/cholesterol/gamma-HCH transport system ATP-binding protein